MFNCIGKVIIVNNSGIIHFGFAKQIAPESIQVGNGNGSTTSEADLEETGRETENQANGEDSNSSNSSNSSTNGNSDNKDNKGNKGKATNGKSKGANKSKSKPTGKTTAAAKKTSAPAASVLPNLPIGMPFGNIGKNHPLLKLMKGFK
ncbi:hypothetical protein [Paenibacillus sp. JDR-2]|uniref:hypothetical protein n=1 Tax=Paenibacillus sp. (strain JDR-2) TaxID=324057 RepID=UPI0001663ED5|nr:hypothetical protein [Paenibacillus sp. JDR-2]ACT02714.1 hypothetical protein Pjdr2_4084 [Paenibacillus sp. JDR-2]